MHLGRWEGVAGFEAAGRLVVVRLGGQASAQAVVRGELDGGTTLASGGLNKVLEDLSDYGLVVVEFDVQFELQIAFDLGASTCLVHHRELDVWDDVPNAKGDVVGLGFVELVVGQTQGDLPAAVDVQFEGGIGFGPHLNPHQGTEVLAHGDLPYLQVRQKIAVVVSRERIGRVVFQLLRAKHVGLDAGSGEGSGVAVAQGDRGEIPFDPGDVLQTGVVDFPVGSWQPVGERPLPLSTWSTT